MTICVMLVAGAVLFGIFGPGVAQRSQLGGFSLGDLVASASMARDQLLAAALAERSRSLRDGEDDDSESARTAAAALMSETLRAKAEAPDLRGGGFELVLSRPATLGGARPNAVARAYLDTVRRAFLALFVSPADGRFVIFDDFGRAVPFTPDHLIVEDLARTRRDESVVLLWSDGTLLWICIADSRADADALRAALTTP